MKDQELLSLWKQQESKMDQLMKMNIELLKEQLNQKAKKALFGMKAEKVTGIVFGTFYVLFLGIVLSIGLKATNFRLDFFHVSVGMIFLVNLLVLINYIKNLVMVSQVKFDGSIASTQKQLLDLKVSLVKTMRIVVIQIPFYTTFHLSSNWFPAQASTPWLLIQMIITGIFTLASVYAFIQFKPENVDKKWVKWMISSAGGSQIERSLEDLKELENFRN